ncbi:uncharacterized protein LOC126905804 isoform X1 [Daktulosphaira vitifoliae]|uniref:uncharacterized protein LOC126905804 isoform X1 n=1 Tax=Daktulosphaira vitifoliae TaxID=58002 RepID=UPI0021AA06E4|nr:uncharacterized protein LOC126905804 isoform X1 [Daktulosphaira vitifoliae]
MFYQISICVFVICGFMPELTIQLHNSEETGSFVKIPNTIVDKLREIYNLIAQDDDDNITISEFMVGITSLCIPLEELAIQNIHRRCKEIKNELTFGIFCDIIFENIPGSKNVEIPTDDEVLQNIFNLNSKNSDGFSTATFLEVIKKFDPQIDIEKIKILLRYALVDENSIINLEVFKLLIMLLEEQNLLKI